MHALNSVFETSRSFSFSLVLIRAVSENATKRAYVRYICGLWAQDKQIR